MDTKDVSDQPPEKSSVALAEERILKFWRDQDIFAKSVEARKERPTYTFYDGPPFATGVPHYGHILVSTIKDAVPRYQTMRGKYVPRRWGWDTHGLPIENIVEKDLKISGKKEIEQLGIDIFNDHARSKVLAYVGEWKKTVDRIGRWVDFDGSYKTMDNDYIESVWWALGELNKKGLVYEGTRVLPYCPRCETPIANSEIAMDHSYKDISDLSVYVKFELVDEPGTYLLAWTTTPWTLPGNTAVAVNDSLDYALIELDGQKIYLGVDAFQRALGAPFSIKDKAEGTSFDFAGPQKEPQQGKILKLLTGKELVGKTYKPLFDYFSGATFPHKENIWKVWAAPYVDEATGSGIVHLAPAFGEEDMALAKEWAIPALWHVGPDGKFTKEVTEFAGLSVKPKGDHQSTDILIIKYLASKGLLFAKEKILHSYPHCFRCETPLYYYAIPAWFVKISEVKPRLLALNEEIHWVPGHLKYGQFRKSMEGAPDWNISRNRYWASPLPIWKCEDCKTTKLLDSTAEIADFARTRNQFVLMRHDESEKNVNQTVGGAIDGAPLTEHGMLDAHMVAETLATQGITKIYASPVERTRQTADIIASALNLPVVFDERLREVNFGNLEGQPIAAYRGFFADLADRFSKRPPGGENLVDVLSRMRNFFQEVNAHNRGEKILVVSHGDPLWLLLASTQKKAQAEEIVDVHYPQLGEAIELAYPEIDLHRPWIDEVTFDCECGGTMRRIPEVFDCWFESGSMPFAPAHVPFENNDWFSKHFPADFITEYLAQTRTWFYYMHVLSGILFDRAPFRNVVTTGNVLAEDGQKMSKSKNNFPDPWLVFDKYGVDAIRFYLLASPVMRSEDMNFTERGLDEVFKKIILRLKNTVAFYELYPDTAEILPEPSSAHVLDRWIVARFDELASTVTASMDAYLLDEALRVVDGFIDDLSVWYVRRSRERMKSLDETERLAAAQTLRFVLYQLSRVLAPFVPFVAEEIYQKVAGTSGKESVHLEDWPQVGQYDIELLSAMAHVRGIVSLGLEARVRAGIKVRQPLAKITIKGSQVLDATLEAILLDELNIKTAHYEAGGDLRVELDTILTPDLILEGHVRELMRHIQSLRKQANLQVGESTTVLWASNDTEIGEAVEQLSRLQLLPATTLEGDEIASGEPFSVGQSSVLLRIKE